MTPPSVDDAPQAPRVRQFPADALHVFVLSAFATAAPVLDKLSQNAEFFAARRSGMREIVFLVLILCVAVPFALLAVESVAGFFGMKARRSAHRVVMAFLMGVIALQAMHNWDAANGWARVALAAVLGIGLATSYQQYKSVYFFLTALVPLTLYIPLNFLLGSPVSKLLVATNLGDAYPDFLATTPVVLVIFDELPLTTLMDARGGLDASRYPNFATFARGATWYRNDTTVADITVNAVPALLSGLYPRGALPIAAEYPRTLFSLLGRSYRLQVHEAVTGLCPKSLLSADARSELDPSFSTLMWDVSVLYLHLALPRDLTAFLPDITQTWKNYGSYVGADSANDRDPDKFLIRADGFHDFVRSMSTGQRPTFYFLHVVLPHVPWRYYPSGRVYAEVDAPTLYARGPNETWVSDVEAVSRSWQRHLLQAGYVDRLLGELLARVKALGIYDQSLIVVVADHGCSFLPGGPRRRLTAANYAEILPVPLFVKLPNQRVGRIDDRNVQNIDVLPSIADVLGIRLQWPLDGRSFVHVRGPERVRKVCFNREDQRFFFPPRIDGKYAVARRKLAVFSRGGHGGLYRIGPHSELMGTPLSRLRLGDTARSYRLINAEEYEDVAADGVFVPGWVRGTLPGGGVGVPLAVSVNGVVQAVTHSFADSGGQSMFEALVQEDVFVSGRNRVEVFEIGEAPDGLTLLRLRNRPQS